jgi:hypothetical protein
MKRALVSFAVASLFLAALPLAAQTGTWTAVGSTAVVDESAAGIYSFGSVNLTYLPGSASTASIVARFNVTNTWGGSSLDTPPWTTMQMGYLDTSPAVTVRADLFQVDPCTGAQTPICTIVSADATAATCKTCTIMGALNFAANVYYVQVTLSRTAATATPPSLLSLRIF